jgi:hypothetical protein
VFRDLVPSPLSSLLFPTGNRHRENGETRPSQEVHHGPTDPRTVHHERDTATKGGVEEDGPHAGYSLRVREPKGESLQVAKLARSCHVF